MTIHIRAGDIHALHVQTRMPFKYGIATMTSTPHAFVRIQAEFDGVSSTGVAADVLPPKWFTKDPDRDIHDEEVEMKRVLQQAVHLATGLHAKSVFELWRTLWSAQEDWGKQAGLPPLLVNFGTSLVERALIEAYCRLSGQPFWRLLRDNAFGIDLGLVHSDLAGSRLEELLPARPLDEIIARHTVGMADPLDDSDIAPAERLQDGLPQSLAACIDTYGLCHFKIKLSGDMHKDRERLRRIASVIRTHATSEFAFSLDGNEQFYSADSFIDYWTQLSRDQDLGDFLTHLLFVEQPFHRKQALDEQAVRQLQGWPHRPALIIDESDAELTSLPQALKLGYAGTSHKNCKGVFKGIANACLLEHQRRAGRPVIMSGEDLANIGPVALLQDLAVCAALGITSVERNGHHFFAGLSMFPDEVQRSILADHHDLYHASRHGWPTLNIRHGRLKLSSINAAPFGVKFAMPVEMFTEMKIERK